MDSEERYHKLTESDWNLILYFIIVMFISHGAIAFIYLWHYFS